jgi:hypothetical protein
MSRKRQRWTFKEWKRIAVAHERGGMVGPCVNRDCRGRNLGRSRFAVCPLCGANQAAGRAGK